MLEKSVSGVINVCIYDS